MTPTNGKLRRKSTELKKTKDESEERTKKMSSLFINFSQTKNFEESDYYLKFVIRKAILTTLTHEGFENDAEVSVTLTDNKYIRKLNKQYRDKDKATDVLSFPMYDFRNGDNPEDDCGAVMLGDIVISVERAKKQAAEVGNPFLTELAFLTVHSVLLGYDHELGKEEDERQCAAQREIMQVLDI